MAKKKQQQRNNKKKKNRNRGLHQAALLRKVQQMRLTIQGEMPARST